MSTRRAPGSSDDPVREIGTGQGEANRSEPDSAFGEATNPMKPERGRDQAATQVKGLSSENVNISEADTFHFSGRQNRMRTAKGKVFTALTESETAAWDRKDDPGTWETQGVVRQIGLRSNKP